MDSPEITIEKLANMTMQAQCWSADRIQEPKIRLPLPSEEVDIGLANLARLCTSAEAAFLPTGQSDMPSGMLSQAM